MKPTTPTTTTLPARSDSSTLAKYHRPGEPIVIVKFTGVGNPSPYDFRAKDNRSYIFRFESKLQGHTLRVPLNLWQQNNAKLAHDMLDERRLPHPMVITLEMPSVEPMEQPSLTDPLIAALIADPDFAWSWHCNIAMAFYDAEQGRKDPAACNAGAALFLSRFTGGEVDTTTHPAYQQTQGGETETSSAKMGATDTNAESRIVVGPGDDSTVAPAGGDLTPSFGPHHPQTVLKCAYDLVESPKRIKALAALLSIDEPLLRIAIARPDSLVELAAAGWVRRKS
jgi:hypothetical protein